MLCPDAARRQNGFHLLMSREGELSWRIDWIRNARITDSKGDLFRPGHESEVYKVKPVNVRPVDKATSNKTVEWGPEILVTRSAQLH